MTAPCITSGVPDPIACGVAGVRREQDALERATAQRTRESGTRVELREREGNSGKQRERQSKSKSKSKAAEQES